MLRRAPILTLTVALAFCMAWVPFARAGGPERPDGSLIDTARLERIIERVMDKADVPGLSCAIIADSRIVYARAFGFRNATSKAPNDEDTIFAGASFSKTVFAYVVMLLAAEGLIDLDRPLQSYLPRPLGSYPQYRDLEGDERLGRITARMVLSHSTGFPNWRWLTDDQRLVFLFPPGARFFYSGEGISLLQMVVEQVTGKDLEELARDKIFEPMGMTRSSFVWQEAYRPNHAEPHDEFGRPRRLNLRDEADAAGSIQTTATDYARFLVSLLNASGERKTVVEQMFSPQVTIDSERMFGPGAWREAGPRQGVVLSWSLGWGRFDFDGGWGIFHTGHDFGWQNYTVTYPERSLGVVLLSNSDNFESVAREIVAAAIGEDHSPFEWLGYVPFDPSEKREPPPDPVAIEVDEELLGDYVGSYDFMGERRILVKLEAGNLHISNDGDDWEKLFAESETRFFVKSEATRFSFTRDADGAVTALRVHVEGLELAAPRIP